MENKHKVGDKVIVKHSGGYEAIKAGDVGEVMHVSASGKLYDLRFAGKIGPHIPGGTFAFTSFDIAGLAPAKLSKGDRVEAHCGCHTGLGTVESVDAAGYVKVNFDNGTNTTYDTENASNPERVTLVAKPPGKYKVGDAVRVLKSSYMSVHVGDAGIVKGVPVFGGVQVDFPPHTSLTPVTKYFNDDEIEAIKSALPVVCKVYKALKLKPDGRLVSHNIGGDSTLGADYPELTYVPYAYTEAPKGSKGIFVFATLDAAVCGTRGYQFKKGRSVVWECTSVDVVGPDANGTLNATSVQLVAEVWREFMVGDKVIIHKPGSFAAGLFANVTSVDGENVSVAIPFCFNAVNLKHENV